MRRRENKSHIPLPQRQGIWDSYGINLRWQEHGEIGGKKEEVIIIVQLSPRLLHGIHAQKIAALVCF